ncbi:MAG TPA: glycosyltransferase family 39 protein [Vicinamibacteria bacterium]|nr:glycosyltransferase family 39 protein [Vicinamibacteria bacterium]
MTPVAPLPATLAGLCVFALPGLVLLALLRPRERDALRFDEALYLVVASSVAFSAWVALALAELGRFSLSRASAVIALVCLAGLVLGRRRLGPPLPRLRRAQDLAPALVVLSLAFALQARPTEYLLGGRDPGTYIAAMGMVARTGGIAYTDPGVLSIPPEDVELFYRNPQNPDYSWGRFLGFPLESPRTGRVFPEFFHLFPAFGAYLFATMGVKGALATPPIFGILGTLGAFFAFRRLFGEATGLLAGLLLATNVVQVWFGRYPVSEPLSQFLLFLALVLLAVFEAEEAPVFGALVGAALGLSLLVRIDSVLIALPLGLYLLVRHAHGELPWRKAASILVPFALLAAHAGLHAALFARKYLVSIATRPYWSQPAWVWALAAASVLVALWAAGRHGDALVVWLEAKGERLRLAVMAGLLLLALYAYFLRPLLSAWAGGDGNEPALRWADASWLEALGFRRLAAHDAQALVRLGWFVSPLALVLALLGLLLAVRDFRPRLLFGLASFLAFAGFYFYKIRVYNDYFFALRRFMPVVVPWIFALAAFLLVRLAARGGPRRLLAGALALALLAAQATGLSPIAAFTDWKGAVRFVEDVARRFQKDDIVVFEQVQSIHLLSLPLWAVHGVNILELARFNPDPERLRHLIAVWRGRYRNLYFVHTYRTDLCGVFLERVEDKAFGSFEWERAYGRVPERPEFRSLHFTISRVVPPEELQVPPLREVDLGGSDDFQVSGFHDKEGGGDETYRWTGACASLYLPGARGGDTVALRVSAGQRPATAKPPVVSASLSGVALGVFTPGLAFADARLRLPDPLPSGPPVLRLDVPAWRPANVLSGSSDTRDLGVMVDRVRLEARPAAHAAPRLAR